MKKMTVVRMASMAMFVASVAKARGTYKCVQSEGDMLTDAFGCMFTGMIMNTDAVEYTIKVGDKDMNIVFNPYLLMCRMIGTAAVTDTGVVIVDNTFLRLSRKTQEFILYHEQGHNAHGHSTDALYPVKRLGCILSGKVLEMEYEADMYAVEHIGKRAAIKALKELRANSIDPICKREITIRIRRLSDAK